MRKLYVVVIGGREQVFTSKNQAYAAARRHKAKVRKLNV